MPFKTATFSNGHTDTYKGKRDVRAAWMITRNDTGEVVMSGHSVDRKRAEGTARNNIITCTGTGGPRRRAYQHPGIMREMAKHYGCDSHPRAVKAEVAKRQAAAIAAHTIEVIDF